MLPRPRRGADLVAVAIVALLVGDAAVLAVRAPHRDHCETRYWHFTRPSFPVDAHLEVQLRTCVHFDRRTRQATVSARARARPSGELDEPVLYRAFVRVGITVAGVSSQSTCPYPQLVSTTGVQADRRAHGGFSGFGTLRCSVSATYTPGKVVVASNPVVDVVHDGYDLVGDPHSFTVRAP